MSRLGALALALVATTARAAVPTVTTGDPEVNWTDLATLRGSATSNGSATTVYFRYSLADPGTCDDLFGVRAPASGGAVLDGADPRTRTFTQQITGLTAGATYYYCVIAVNADGVAFGAVRSFTLVLAAPTVTTPPAGPYTPRGSDRVDVMLNGSVIPNQSSSFGHFRYSLTNPGTCDDVFGTRVPASGAMSLGSGTSIRSYSIVVGGLLTGATYHYCAIAFSNRGTGFGNVESFTTPAAAPVVATNGYPEDSRTGTTARIGGWVNPGGGETTGWLRYATSLPASCDDSFGTRVPAAGGTSLGSGRAGVEFSQVLTGLAPGTTYYYCAIAQNAAGTSFGAFHGVTTPLPPVATTRAASDITNASATLSGAATARGARTLGYFRYSLTDPGTCDDAFGARAPVTSGTPLGGSSPQNYSHGLTGLSAGTTYYYCAVAVNGEGTAFGAVMAFTTAAAPTVTTSAASGVTSSTGTLNGSATPNGGAAYGYHRYSTTDPGTCDDSFGTRVPASSTADVPLGAGSAEVGYGQPLADLLPGTRYFYCALAYNTYGRASGAVQSFTTSPVPPAAATHAATLLTGRTAQLNGTGNPGGASATGWFRYSASSPGTCDDSFGTRAPDAGGSSLGAGSSSTSFSQQIAGLTPGTTYFYCSIVQTSVGTSFGSVQSFTTPLEPAVSTLAATAVGATSATLHGVGVPNGNAAVGWFRYGAGAVGACDDTFGTRAPASSGSSLGSGTSGAAFEEALTGLVPGTTYQFCAIVQSAAGTVYGALESFTTPALPPAVTTHPATVVGSAVTLHGSAVPNGDPATGWFRYSPSNPGTCDDAFGTRVPASGGTALGSGATVVEYAEPVSGLSPVTSYHFCAIASNATGVSFGQVLSVTTGPAAPSVATSPPTDVAPTSAVLGGVATPGGDETTGWFRVSATDPAACDDTFGTRVPESGGTALGSGKTPVSFSVPVARLTPGATYYVCAIAGNSVGTRAGEVQVFQPGLVAPTVTTEAATGVQTTGATIAGTANPNGTETSGWFRLGDLEPVACDDSFGERLPASGGHALGAGTGAATFTEELTGLEPNLTYSYCAAASSLGGASFGPVRSFTTQPAPPVIGTLAATVSGSDVTLSAAANPRGAQTTAWFRYDAVNPGSCDDTFGTRTDAAGDAALGAGRAEVPFTQTIAGPGVGTWYACAIASNAGGLAYGAVETFEIRANDAGATGAAPGAGGCGCGAGGGSGGWIVPALAIVLALARRRRVALQG